MDLVDRILVLMEDWGRPTVVITGGEPLLQLRTPSGEWMVHKLQSLGVRVHVETNGTVEADILEDLQHVTVSPGR